MLSGKDYKRHARAILLMVSVIIAVSTVMISMSLRDFKQVQHTWMQHTEKSNAITTALANIRDKLGYGGFIHNFKNLILRRDIARYQPTIEHDIADVQQHLFKLSHLLPDDTNQQALSQIQQTFAEYQGKYQIALMMITEGASVNDIDASVKVDDSKALQALMILDKNIALMTSTMLQDAQQTSQRANQFLLVGSLLMLPVLILMSTFIAKLLSRIVGITDDIFVTKQDVDNLLETAPDPTLCVNAEGNVIRVNKAASDYFNQQPNSLLGQAITKLVTADTSTQPQMTYQHYLAFMQNKQKNSERIICKTITGEEVRSVEIKLSHTHTNAGSVTTLTLRDITEQLQMRNALIIAKDEAEQNLARQKAMQDELVRSEKMAALGKLVAGVAHEVNTPVGIILTASSHLQTESIAVAEKYADETLSAKLLEAYLKTAVESSELIKSSCERAAELIQSFKLVAVDQTNSVRRQFNLAAYLNEVLLSLGPSFKERFITVDLKCAKDIVLDSYPGMIAQVLSNLIINSLTHAFAPEQPGKISINVNLLEQPADWLEIQYEDDGIGIPTELHNRVFEPFFTTNRQQGGSGLGLHIVFSGITQLLAGSIAFSSSPGQGTCFIIRIPLSVPTNVAEHSTEA